MHNLNLNTQLNFYCKDGKQFYRDAKMLIEYFSMPTELSILIMSTGQAKYCRESIKIFHEGNFMINHKIRFIEIGAQLASLHNAGFSFSYDPNFIIAYCEIIHFKQWRRIRRKFTRIKKGFSWQEYKAQLLEIIN